MRHKIAGNKLNRNQTLRKVTVRDIAKATILRQRIMTTKAKAKEARKLVDKLITLGKGGSLADKRRAYSILCDHKVVSLLFKRSSALFKERNGGYTRIIPISNRRGDNAQMAFLELTEKEDIVISQPKSTAAAKKEKVKSAAKDEEQPEEKVDKKEKVAKKEEEKKLEKPKVEKRDTKPKDKPTTKDKFAGLRKMFRRKAT